MGWTIVIGEAPSQFTIDASAKFDLQTRITDNEAGATVAKEFFVEVEGDVVESSPGDVADSLADIFDEVQNVAPRRVQLKLDGVTKFDFKPQESVGSPKILFFKTVPEDGNGSSHWRYAFTIYVKQAGNQGGQEDVFELQTSILTVKENGKIVKKVWRASAKARTLAAALAQVMAFKPAENFVREEVEKYFQENRAAAAWTWDARKSDKILSIKEEVRVTRAGVGYGVDKQVGKNGKPAAPIFHAKPLDAARIEIQGVVRGFVTPLQAPPPHYAASANMKRQSDEENFGFTEIEDEIKGIYRLAYSEVYLTTATPIPSPNHGDHKDIQFATPPADGAIAQ